ncbi:hypothetical protein [Pseudomonas fluorescens]|uniref:hypothetical protein n=1 Tax=Pseudomonas fluorescens TaxID=294 RepID=UPI0011CD74F8|nr:hypothetical protein [Pseudomonas fluorescens]
MSNISLSMSHVQTGNEKAPSISEKRGNKQSHTPIEFKPNAHDEIVIPSSPRRYPQLATMSPGDHAGGRLPVEQ